MQTIKLHNGVVMPVLGFGVYQVPPEETARTVTEAIEIGYRILILFNRITMNWAWVKRLKIRA